MGNRMKRWAAAALCALLTLGLAGCDLPMLGFADYDVSAYLQALLDSSYKNSHAQFLEVAGGDASAAQANNDTTVENTAVEFCNTYNLAMDETQMDRLEEILGEALAQARYTVKEEQKVDTGYYIEVEVTPSSATRAWSPSSRSWRRKPMRRPPRWRASPRRGTWSPWT